MCDEVAELVGNKKRAVTVSLISDGYKKTLMIEVSHTNLLRMPTNDICIMNYIIYFQGVT